MKSISNSDFSLLVEKLPIVNHCAKGNITSADIKGLNAIRLLTMLQMKLKKQIVIKQKSNDKK